MAEIEPVPGPSTSSISCKVTRPGCPLWVLSGHSAQNGMSALYPKADMCTPHDALLDHQEQPWRWRFALMHGWASHRIPLEISRYQPTGALSCWISKHALAR